MIAKRIKNSTDLSFKHYKASSYKKMFMIDDDIKFEIIETSSNQYLTKFKWRKNLIPWQVLI